MGLEASIDISYHKEIELKIFLESLFEYGWRINDYNKTTYLINDDLDWESSELDDQDLIVKLLFERFLNNKIAGIALTLPNLNGGLFHFMPGKKEILILLSINRVKFKDTQFTDYSFYLEKLYPVIRESTKVNYRDIV